MNAGARTAYSEPIVFGPGAYTVTCYAKDLAGRTHAVSRSFTVV